MFNSKKPIPVSKNPEKSRLFFILFPMLAILMYFGTYSTIKLLQNSSNTWIISLIPAAITTLIVFTILIAFWGKEKPKI